jgi:effector-binding domain-containing protein
MSGIPTQVVERFVRASPTAVIAETTTWAEYPQVWRRLLDEVWSVVRADGSITAGRNVMLYNDDTPNVEVGVEVDAPFEPIGRVVCSSLPEGRVAMTTHRGSFDVAAAHESVVAACDAWGLERVGPRWEIYGHWNKPGDEEVEIYYLVRSSDS